MDLCMNLRVPAHLHIHMIVLAHNNIEECTLEH